MTNQLKMLFFYLFFATSFNLFAQSDTTEIAYEYLKQEVIGIKILKVQNKYGIKNDTGLVTMPFHFDEISFFGKRDSVTCTNWAGVVLVRTGKLLGLANGINGKGLTPLQYEEMQFLPEVCTNTTPEARLVRTRIKNKFGLASLKGDELIPCNYEGITLLTDKQGKLSNPEIAIVNKMGKFGFMVIKTKQIIPATYDEVKFFQDIPNKAKIPRMLMLLIKQKGKVGVFNLHSEDQIPMEFDEIEPFDTKLEMAVARKNNKFGCIDYKGKEKIKFEYDFADGIRSGMIIFKKGRKFGIMAAADKKIKIPFEYDNMEFLVKAEHNNQYFTNLLRVQKGNKQGIMNVEGKMLVPIEYDELVLEEAKFGFKAKKDGKDEFVVLK